MGDAARWLAVYTVRPLNQHGKLKYGFACSYRQISDIAYPSRLPQTGGSPAPSLRRSQATSFRAESSLQGNPAGTVPTHCP